MALPTLSQTQIKLIEAYLILVSQEGIENVTLQKVADQAKVSFGTVRYNFSDETMDMKQGAILYVFTRGYEFLTVEMAAPTKKNENKLYQYVRANFEWLRQRPLHASFVIYFYYLCMTKIDRGAHGDYIRIGRDRVKSLLFECIGEGRLPTVRDADSLAFKIHSFLMGTMLATATTEGFPRNVDSGIKETIAGINSLIASHAVATSVTKDSTHF